MSICICLALATVSCIILGNSFGWGMAAFNSMEGLWLVVHKIYNAITLRLNFKEYQKHCLKAFASRLQEIQNKHEQLLKDIEREDQSLADIYKNGEKYDRISLIEKLLTMDQEISMLIIELNREVQKFRGRAAVKFLLGSSPSDWFSQNREIDWRHYSDGVQFNNWLDPRTDLDNDIKFLTAIRADYQILSIGSMNLPEKIRLLREDIAALERIVIVSGTVMMYKMSLPERIFLHFS